MTAVSVIGAGGHAKVVIATLQAAGFSVHGIYDDDEARVGREILGIPVSGTTAERQLRDRPAVVAVGDNRARAALVDRLGDVSWQTVVHPRACVHHSVRLGAGTVVFAGAVIQPDARTGVHCIVNTGATIDHDCTLGDFVHVAPGSHLAGNVTLGTGALFGVGAHAIPGIEVGEWATVAAGACVVSDLPRGVTAIGVPARARHP